LFAEIRAHGHKDVVFMESFETAISHLKQTLRSGDILLTLGAGDVYKLGESLLEEL